jgi:hypothetical protein
VKLQTPHDVTVDGPGTWENYLLSKSKEPVYATWDVSIKANQTLTFSRVLHFPMIDGEYWVGVSVASVSVEGFGTDSFYVFITNDRGTIVKAGTPIPPLTPLIAATVYGPGTPVPTNSIITNTPIPSPVTNPTSTQFAPLVVTSTPLTSPYPPPSSSTPHSSPYP